MEKICVNCNVRKPLFSFTKDSKNSDLLNRRCKDCCKIAHDSYYKNNKDRVRERNADWRLKNEQLIKVKRKEKRAEDPRKCMLYSAKHRAKMKNLEFDLSIEDIQIPEYCPVLKIKIEMYASSQSRTSPSIDRIDTTKGYTKDNIQVISWLANTMKSNANFEELISFADWVNTEIKTRSENVK